MTISSQAVTNQEAPVSDELIYEVKDHVAYLTLNRPKALNSISDELDLELAKRWREIDEDPDIWVAVLSASGDRAFCVGKDISGGTEASASRIIWNSSTRLVRSPTATL